MIKHNLPPGDYVGISKAGTTVAVVITEGGFWAHEFRSKLQVELDDIASIMPARPEARLAEPERPTLCAKCNDHIIADDGAVCEICADTMDTIITELQTRIAELEAELKAYKFALENAIIDRTLGGNTPLAQYVADARAELNRQAQEERCLTK